MASLVNSIKHLKEEMIPILQKLRKHLPTDFMKLVLPWYLKQRKTIQEKLKINVPHEQERKTLKSINVDEKLFNDVTAEWPVSLTWAVREIAYCKSLLETVLLDHNWCSLWHKSALLRLLLWASSWNTLLSWTSQACKVISCTW